MSYIVKIFKRFDSIGRLSLHVAKRISFVNKVKSIEIILFQK